MQIGQVSLHSEGGPFWKSASGNASIVLLSSVSGLFAVMVAFVDVGVEVAFDVLAALVEFLCPERRLFMLLKCKSSEMRKESVNNAEITMKPSWKSGNKFALWLSCATNLKV